MPNRSASEREPAYRELLAGHSPHKGVVDLSATLQQDVQIEPGHNPAPLLPIPPVGLRERVFRLLRHLRP